MSEAFSVSKEALRDLRSLINYAEWQILEGKRYHPSLPTTVARAKRTLSKLSASPPAKGNGS